MFYSVTFQKIIFLTGIGIIIGAIIGFSSVLGFGLDGSVFVISMFLSIISVYATAMYAELYHIREAINKQNKNS
ncbi:hypothetical protein SAMN05192559_11122 [Halobacillus karajensis]|uniref:Uncharacterized protein n=1 Tax=Halobacillus karajensis TaxID=195088 RepID=A0A024P8P7_9BACI|nr:hypothetical protein [Halobacillus karajensis]CDQ21575.1 hypothetical protein BN982_03978 [Halobacillus karajensis]CDQ25509.1 hypothetical protein BN983_03856 [Halobacillus karajensis]CDQ28960.1 hypothetical protein BN981_03303 [Halobacillus karajensis]SEI08825.1 hypothetical protein SAMN05192559_11122 [Halobacillus karajensis]